MPISPEYASTLATAVEQAAARYRSVTEADASRRPAPGKWSAKEIIGHLVDSASNNHQRFVRARMKDDLVFEGYEQERWVALQQYADAPWRDLVELWRLFNLHIARVMALTPEAERLRPRSPHNLDRIAAQTFDPAQPARLEGLMSDYVAHLQKHLAQIDAIVSVR